MAGIFALEAQIIILDEPSAALDPDSTERLIDLLNSQTNKTIVIISHDLDFVARTCRRVIGVKNGSIIGDLPVFDFFSNDELLSKLDVMPVLD